MDIIQGATVDEKFPAQVFTQLLSERAHTGNVFATSHEFNNVSPGGVADVLLQAPTNGDEVHVVTYAFTPDVSSETVKLYEDPALSTTGSAPDADVATQRSDGFTPSATVTVGPSVDSVGTLLSLEGVPDGGPGRGENAPVEVDGVDIGLDGGTDYLLRFTNDSSNTADTIYFTMLRYRFGASELKE